MLGILVIVSVNVINHVMLVSIWIIKIVSVEKLVEKFVKECNEIVEEVKIVGKNKDKCGSCIL